ncbi:MAG: ATP-binding cassette domain-containing protein [Eggerthella lenta]
MTCCAAEPDGAAGPARGRAGRSGAGKSTLASLVRGDIRPDAGGVTLGGLPTADLGDEAAKWIGSSSSAPTCSI